MGVALLSAEQRDPTLREVLFAAAAEACATPRLNPEITINTPDERKWLRNHALDYVSNEDSATLTYAASSGMSPDDCLSSVISHL